MKVVAGAVIAVLGIVFFLQGINVLGGSGMSGKPLWAVLGPIIALVGVAIIMRSRRTSTTHDV